MDKIKLDIAGEITLADNAGAAMKKWREIFGITQTALAKHLNITVSTISDYESNRRQSPGTAVIKRFVHALFDIDAKNGGAISQRLTEREKPTDQYFEVHEFARGITLKDFVEIIRGKAITNEDLLEGKKIYGYTLIDSLKTILEIPFSFFQSLYGNINERVFIFTGVSTGRSPMVVIRVSPSKPSAVVMHGIEGEKMDKLALKISEKERIPMITTKLSVQEMKEALNKI